MSTEAFRSSGDLSADRRYLWAEAAGAEKDHAAAADLYRQALELAPGWPSAWFALGRALKELGERDDAVAALRRCLALEPADALGAALLIRQLDPAGETWDIPAKYVESLFDAYADRFDAHLTGQLAYRGPQILRDALQSLCARDGHVARFETVIDLGCGTGLMALALDGMADVIDGVDLSRRMLDKARLTGRYRALVAGDIVTCLRDPAAGTQADLIIAADVLVYIGDLAPLFAAVRARLANDGLFAFTVQACAGNSFQLGNDLRAAHSAGYIRKTAQSAGLAVRLLENASTRQDAGVDVPGLVVVLAL